MKTITTHELLTILLNPSVSGINGASFVGFDTFTEVSLKGGKANEMQGKIQKITLASNVIVFSNKNVNGYEEMLKRRLISEGKNVENFHVKPRKWGCRLENAPIVENKGCYYFEVIFLHCGEDFYLYNGNPIDKKDIIGLDLEKEERKQNFLNSDLIVFRDYKITSIKRITINKETYIVI